MVDANDEARAEAAWQAWLEAHPNRRTEGAVYRPGFIAGFTAAVDQNRALQERVEALEKALTAQAQAFRDAVDAWNGDAERTGDGAEERACRAKAWAFKISANRIDAILGALAPSEVSHG